LSHWLTIQVRKNFVNFLGPGAYESNNHFVKTMQNREEDSTYLVNDNGHINQRT